MNAKDLRTDSALGARINDGCTKFAQSGNSLQSKSNKPSQDIGSYSLAKVDVQTSRPCAIIGPDRVLPSPNCNDGFVKKNTPESWPCPDSIYRQPPDYPHKMSEYQPIRNISPRQTFQENMQRIMVSPYNSIKKSDDPNFPVDRNTAMLKNVKLNMSSEAKYCDVPYTINTMCNEQKNVRIAEISGSNGNPVVTRNAAHGWVPNNVNVRPLKSYGASELYQYPDYPSCAGPRPVPMIRPHRTVHEESGRMYPEHHYQDANLRFRPYPPSKGRYPQSRYDYVNNYSNTFHPPPPFPNHSFDPQKTVTAHSYPLYPQVPLKYIDRRMGEPIMDGYQRASPQTNLNMAYRSSLIHPPYGPLQANCMQNNMFSYPSENPKSMIANKLPYSNNNKIYIDYEAAQHKKIHISETVYSNNVNHSNSLKGEVLCPNYSSVNMHGLPQYPLYRKEYGPMKNYEYLPHFRSLDPAVNFHNPLLRHPIHFSPNTIAISPSDSNTSNDTSQTHTTQDDCGYVSQSSTTSGRSVSDLHSNGFPNEQHLYKSPEYRYGHVPRNIATQVPNSNKISKAKKGLDVRQFLQMWNEGDDESNEQNKDESTSKDTTDINNISNQYESANKQEQLYVLGLVNVPSEELDKYDHIQKISKLPENIKGYNNIELLNQFEEAIESSNVPIFSLKPQREFHTQIKNNIPKNQINTSRPISPLDVEAKISQSVIHKEVGCNFEIKPCSPKMLNVEIATPIQKILDERIIEKISNPIASKPCKSQKVEKVKVEISNFNNGQNIHCEDSSKDRNVGTSCTLENLECTNENSMTSMKQNYNLQDLEYNSSVCLASLPRLDNDIELNFPEINQQFINANNIEPALTSVKDLPVLNSDQIDNNISEDKSTLTRDVEHTASSVETDKEVTKLSKYRKIKKTDVEQNDNQSKTVTKIQLRTDSVIIKNPDTMKTHEINPNSSNNKSINLNPDLSNEENIIDDSLTKEIVSVVEFNSVTKNGNEENNNIGIEKRKLELPTDTAIDFSLNRSNTESSKTYALKENIAVEPLLNFIEDDLISETYDKNKLIVFATNVDTSSDIKECLKFNDDKINLQTGVHEEEFLKSEVETTVSEFYSNKNLKNEKESDDFPSQEDLFYNTNNVNLSKTSTIHDTFPNNIMKIENHLIHKVTNNSLDNTDYCPEKILLNPPTDEDSILNKKDENVNTFNKIYLENCLTNVDILKPEIVQPKISEEHNKQLDEESSLNNTSYEADMKYVNDNAKDNSDIELKLVQSQTQNIVKNNTSTLLDVQKTDNKDKISEDVIIDIIKDYNASSIPKLIDFKKRLHSYIIQNLILFNDKSIQLEKNNESLIAKNKSILSFSKHINESMHEKNIDIIKLETLLSQPVNNNPKQLLSNESSDKQLDSENLDINFHSLLEIVKSDSDKDYEISNNKHNLNNIQNTKIISNSFLLEGSGSDLDNSKHTDCSLKFCPNSNLSVDTPVLSSTKYIKCEDRNIKSNYIDFNTNKEGQINKELRKEFLNKEEELLYNPRAHLKRSLSDSALNIYSNDEHQVFNSQNNYTIPKKRKKINPCEMMEPNQVPENCNIVQTNRRNSISTFYDEENVSFCILIDNSCVLTEENVESQKICLAEITEDAFESEFKSDCTFTTGEVIFTDNFCSNVLSPVNEDLKAKFNSDNVEFVNDFTNEYTIDQHSENEAYGEEAWIDVPCIEDVACIETVFSDDVVEDTIFNPSSSPKEHNVLQSENDGKINSLIYSDNEDIEKIKYIYGNEMCSGETEIEETMCRTPKVDLKKTLIRRESHYSDESNRYYDNDSLEKILSESNDNDELSNEKCYNSKENVLCLNKKMNNDNMKMVLPSESIVKCENKYSKSDSYENLYESSKINYEPTQYDLVHSCESTCDYANPYKHNIESPKYSSSSSPEVSSTTSEEKSCGILLKITNCNGSISSQINEFSAKTTDMFRNDLSESKELVSNINSLSRKRPLITKAAQKYIPPLKETICDLKVKLPLPQHSLNKLKILKISKDKTKSDNSINKCNNSLKSCYPKKTKPKFEDVLKSIDEIQIRMHKEKNKKHKHSIPKVVIKKNQNGAHYTSTSNNKEDFNPDLTGRKWQPWVFIEKNCFIDKMALNNKIKAIFSHRKNTYVLAEKFRKYKSVNNARFVITQPKLEDISSGKLKYTIRLKHNY